MQNYKADNLGCTRGECFGKELNAPQNCNRCESGRMIRRTLKLFSSHSCHQPSFGAKAKSILTKASLTQFSFDSICFHLFIECPIIHRFGIFQYSFWMYIYNWSIGCIYDRFFVGSIINHTSKFMPEASISILGLVFASHGDADLCAASFEIPERFFTLIPR